MANLVRLEHRGNSIYALFDDGSRVPCHPIAGAAWLAATPAAPGPDPDPSDPTTFNMVSNDGALAFTIQEQGMKYARTIFNAGKALDLPRDGIVAAFMCVMVEAPPFLMYANSGIPESLNYPHDAVGSDHDSLGLFQQRPAAGWGTVAELMDADYNARAFYGGPSGPNYPSPAGLLDISPPWDQRATVGAAVQAVQVSAHPYRYDNWTTACYALYDALDRSGGSGDFAWHFIPRPSNEGGDMPPNGSSDQPLAEFGPRNLTGSMHEGMDFGYGSALSGAPIRATGAGVVDTSAVSGGWGNMILLFHGTRGDKDLYTRHAHMQALGPAAGSSISLGQELGLVGATGNVFGPHDHYETHVCAVGERPVNNINDPVAYRTAIDPREFHATYGNDVM